MLQNGKSNFIEFINQVNCRIDIQQVVVRDFLTMDLVEHCIKITIEELNIEGIHTDLTMIYAPQSVVEKWSRKDYGQADATYTLPAGFVVKARNGENLTDNLAMGFIAVPVDKADMEAVLNIRYSVKVASVNGGTPVEFEASFDLSDYTSLGWMSNHKVKYELVIDTGISLKGRITDWIEVDYIEGIVLPEIKEE